MPNWSYRKPDNLVELFESAVERFAQNRFLGVKSPDRSSLCWLTYQQVGERVDHLRAALSRLGVGEGDSVGIISNNRPEWAIAAFATYGLRARFVPMYEAELPRIWRHIITDASVKVLFVANAATLEKLGDLKAQIPTLQRVLLIDGEGPDSMDSLEAQGARDPVPSSVPGPNEIAVLIYTSGTTGEPKGVLLSHGNLTHCARSGYILFPELDANARSLSILPWAHSYGQSAELNNWLQFGGSIGFMERVETLAQDLTLVQPTFLIAVPRIFNKIYNGIHAKMRAEGGLKLMLFRAAVKAARQKRALAEKGEKSWLVQARLKVLDRLVFSKIRARFGGKLLGSLTASATMNPEIARFFFDIGIPVYDCYGLTETSPAVTMNCSTSFRPGSVGRAVDAVRIEIDRSVVEPEAEDGEIIVHGPNVMQGYHGRPEETAKVLTPEGGFRTGDRGRLDQDGFLFITGRIKEQYKLENGKYVFPAHIEEEIKLNPAIANALVYGDGRPYNVCLVHLDPVWVESWSKTEGMPGLLEKGELQPRLRDQLVAEIQSSLSGKMGTYEIPRKFLFVREDFTLENGMLSQTMKLKRKVVLERYQREIEALFQSEPV